MMKACGMLGCLARAAGTEHLSGGTAHRLDECKTGRGPHQKTPSQATACMDCCQDEGKPYSQTLLRVNPNPPSSRSSMSARTYCRVSSLVTFFSTVRKAFVYSLPPCSRHARVILSPVPCAEVKVDAQGRQALPPPPQVPCLFQELGLVCGLLLVISPQELKLPVGDEPGRHVYVPWDVPGAEDGGGVQGRIRVKPLSIPRHEDARPALKADETDPRRRWDGENFLSV